MLPRSIEWAEKEGPGIVASFCCHRSAAWRIAIQIFADTTLLPIPKHLTGDFTSAGNLIKLGGKLESCPRYFRNKNESRTRLARMPTAPDRSSLRS